MINHISMKQTWANGSFKANVRLGGILVGTFRKKVYRDGSVRMFLPGGSYDFDSDRYIEPITVLYKGKFANRELKEELHRLAFEWWKLHMEKQAVDVRDLPKISYTDRGWTKETTVYVRPVSYVPKEAAEAAGRPWDAGKAEVVFLEDDLELKVSIPIRRREEGVEAVIPKWSIEKLDADHLGTAVTKTEYVPKFRFHAGGGFIDSAVLGAVAVIWAWYFRVPEPFVTRLGTCGTCKFLKYLPEERALTHKDDPVPRRWFCTRMHRYIDDAFASSRRIVDLAYAAQEKQIAREMAAVRFEHGCEMWEASSSASFAALYVQGKKKTYANPLDGNRLDRAMRALAEPVVFFDAPGFHDENYPDASIPEVRVWVRPLIEGAPEQDYWRR